MRDTPGDAQASTPRVGHDLTAVSNCTVVDVREGRLVPGRSIRFKDGVIAAIVNGSDPAGDGAVLDAAGAFAVPGLIDMHVHICANAAAGAGAGPEERYGSASRMAIHAVENLRSALAAGVTTVRDLGGSLDVPFEVKRAWREQLFTGARPLVAGPMVTAVGGHGTERGSRLGLEVSGTDEVRRTVRGLIGKGADIIKVVTGGVVARTELTAGELAAAVDEAHWCHVPVASHANFSLRGIRNSIEAGCDSIEHCCVPDLEALETMAARRIALCPTITVLARIKEQPELFGGVRSPLVLAVQRAWPRHLKNVRLAASLGVPLVAGTDAGMPAVGHDALVEELEWLERCGLTPIDALRCATLAAADALGRSDLGELTASRSADLLLVAHDPTRSVASLRDVRAVVLAGRLVQRNGHTRRDP